MSELGWRSQDAQMLRISSISARLRTTLTLICLSIGSIGAASCATVLTASPQAPFALSLPHFSGWPRATIAVRVAVYAQPFPLQQRRHPPVATTRAQLRLSTENSPRI